MTIQNWSKRKRINEHVTLLNGEGTGGFHHKQRKKHALPLL